MHTSMQRLVNAQEEMCAQIEVLHRAMRNHFMHKNTNVNSNNAIINNDFQLNSFQNIQKSEIEQHLI